MAAYLQMVRQSWNKMCCKRILILLSVFFSVGGFAAQDRYHFETPEQEKRYQQMLLHIRCMVCENQPLAESNAPLAEDLRLEVYQQIVAGKQDPEIKAFLVERYGDSVLYEPPVQSNTFILWFGPLVLLLIGMIVWIYRVRK
ncbi:MAG: cytochrome c-type biogenesis protein CcmH [Gammaproteobacteria bacterium]